MSEDNNLQAQPVVMTAVVEIKRAATGKVETYTLTGTVPAEPKKEEHGSHP